MTRKKIVTYSETENPPYAITVKVPRKSIVEEYQGALRKLFPELENVTDEELERLKK